jgi:hypothetical protein
MCRYMCAGGRCYPLVLVWLYVSVYPRYETVDRISALLRFFHSCKMVDIHMRCAAILLLVCLWTGAEVMNSTGVWMKRVLTRQHRTSSQMAGRAKLKHWRIT